MGTQKVEQPKQKKTIQSNQSRGERPLNPDSQFQLQNPMPRTGVERARMAKVMQRKLGNGRTAQKLSSSPIQRKENKTGLPDNIKSSVETLSGYSMDDVKVHYNSSKPAQLQAHAYAQGTNIHVAPGQQKHVAHEAWHVVQQKQGRVKPTIQRKGIEINDDHTLEREAEQFSQRLNFLPEVSQNTQLKHPTSKTTALPIVQRYKDVLTEKYEHEKSEKFQMLKEVYLQKFSAIQKFLSNIKRTKPYLDQLNQAMSNNNDLSSLLIELMPQWSDNLTTLVGLVPRDEFIKMGQGGQLFEDYVDLGFIGGKLSHGIQSHRIQWYLISCEFGAEEAFDLYRVALDPIWKTEGNQLMWDLIVDGSSNDEHDFTQPGKLHRYLDEQYKSPFLQKNYLTTFIKNEQSNFSEKRKALRKLMMAQKIESESKPTKTAIGGDSEWSGWRDLENGFWAPTIMEPLTEIPL